LKCYIDAGNTRIKWQVGVKAQTQQQSWPKSEAMLVAWAASLNPAGGGVIERFIIASVVPQDRQAQLAQALTTRYPDVIVQWIVSRARCCGVQLGYPDVSQFGVDRFCALAAARRRFPRQALIVINAGTAVTVDYLKADGRHEGGVIMPSLAAMTAGLNQLAPHLAPFWHQKPQMAAVGHSAELGLATNTAGALQLGSRWMLASALAQIIIALSEGALSASEQESPPVIVVSGGGAVELLPLLDLKVISVPDLVLEGIRIAARQPQPSGLKKTAKKAGNATKELPSKDNSD
jgi:type III pantothenate kinase